VVRGACPLTGRRSMIVGPLPRSGSSATTWCMVWQRTKHPGVYVRHARSCPSAGNVGARCRCRPSYRASRRHPLTGKLVSSPSFADINEALSWYLAAGEKAKPVLRGRAQAGRTFQSLADEWWEGVEQGRIGKRRGQRGYSPTTLQGGVLCRPAPQRDGPAGVVRRRPRPPLAGRAQIKERRRERPAAADRRAAQADPAAGVHAAEPA
jgi:hypothetical protein